MYVIERRPGEYVAQPGSHHSYTRNILKAQKFQSLEIAKGNACGDERVLSFDNLMRGRTL